MNNKPIRGSRELRQRARDLRRKMTLAEKKLWHCLRGRRLNGLKFRRQHPLDRFIADFYCAEHRLILEIDGEVHKSQTARDEQRTVWLEQREYRVLRFTNQQVFQNVEAVLEQIVDACQ